MNFSLLCAGGWYPPLRGCRLDSPWYGRFFWFILRGRPMVVPTAPWGCCVGAGRRHGFQAALRGRMISAPTWLQAGFAVVRQIHLVHPARTTNGRPYGGRGRSCGVNAPKYGNKIGRFRRDVEDAVPYGEVFTCSPGNSGLFGFVLRGRPQVAPTAPLGLCEGAGARYFITCILLGPPRTPAPTLSNYHNNIMFTYLRKANVRQFRTFA